MKKAQRERITCGSCSFLMRERLDGNTSSCSICLGKIPTSRACASHKPDAFTAINSEHKVDALADIAHAVASFGARDLEVLATLLLREKTTRKQGFRFMQKVFVRFQGNISDNYMNNFVIGYVVDADKEYIRVVSATGKICLSVLNDANSTSLYTVEQFADIRRQMKQHSMYNDPKTMSIERSSMFQKMDALDKSGAFDETNTKRNKKVKRAEPDDLVSIVSRLNRGIMKSDKKESRETISIRW